MQTIQSEEEAQELIRSQQLLLFQLGAETCAPCGAIREKLDEWTRRQTAGIRPCCRYVPADVFPALAAQMGVFSVPTILVYVQGRESLRESGYFSLEDLLRRVERYETLLEEQGIASEG